MIWEGRQRNIVGLRSFTVHLLAARLLHPFSQALLKTCSDRRPTTRQSRPRVGLDYPSNKTPTEGSDLFMIAFPFSFFFFCGVDDLMVIG